MHTLAAMNTLDFIDEDHKLLTKNVGPMTVISKLHRFHQAATVIDSALYLIEADEVFKARY